MCQMSENGIFGIIVIMQLEFIFNKSLNHMDGSQVARVRLFK